MNKRLSLRHRHTSRQTDTTLWHKARPLVLSAKCHVFYDIDAWRSFVSAQKTSELRFDSGPAFFKRAHLC